MNQSGIVGYTTLTLPILQCQKCKYEWTGKVEQPKLCPRCKRYDWRIPKKEKNN